MNKEAITEIAKQLGIASKDVLELLARYTYLIGITRSCSIVISIVAAGIFSSFCYRKSEKPLTEDRSACIMITTLGFAIVCAFVLSILSKFIIYFVDPQASAMVNLMDKF